MKMQKVITKSIMKDSDKYTIEHKLSSIELMHKAAEAVMNNYPFKGKVLIVTGTGNNAGDGYALALLLNKAHIEVNILQTKAEYSNDGKYYYDLCQKNNIKTFLYNGTFNFKNYDVLVDAIYGIGFHGNMPNQISSLINQMNESNLPIVSVDINSGLDADNGLAKTCVHSTLTVSIGALKPGHLLNMAKDNIDKLVNQNIGIDIVGEPYYLLEHDDFKDFLPKRKNFSHKGTYGLVGILGGSLKYSGSVKLASLSLSALTSGAGVSRLIVPKTITKSLLLYVLESTIFPINDDNGQMIFDSKEIDKALEKVTALLIGIGWDQNPNNKKILTYILENYNFPIVIDADGLNILSKTNKIKQNLILTPHLKEFSRLTGIDIDTISKNPINIAKTYAKEHEIILLLKGPSTIITDGNTVYLINTGCSGMATAGSGDVLSGILIGLLGYKSPNIKTVAFAAYINGLAGELAEKQKSSVSMLARDTASCLAKAIKPYIQK